VLDLLRKGKFCPFYFFSKFMITRQKASPLSNCSKRQVWSRFGVKSGPNLPFSKHLPHVTQIIQKGTFRPDFSPNLDQTCLFEQFESGPKWTCLLTRDHKFRKEIKWTKLAFSKQVQHVILNSFKHFSGPKYKTLGI